METSRGWVITCIVGVVKNGKVWIGGDSLGSDRHFNCTVRSDVKVFKNGSALIGYCGSYRIGQILKEIFVTPPKPCKITVFNYMVRYFIPQVMKTLNKQGAIKINNNIASIGGNFLVGYGGHLFNIQADLQVGESSHKFDACGCGEPYALGALATMDFKDPKKDLLRVLTIAQEFSAGVRGPFTILST